MLSFRPIWLGKYTVADMLTGYGVAEAVKHYYAIYGGELEGKRAIVQGFGNVGFCSGLLSDKARSQSSCRHY